MEHGRRIVISLFLGAIFTLLGLLGIILTPTVITSLIHQKLVLNPSNPGFELWRTMDLPIYEKFYLYNVTNPREVELHGARPNLVQLGPWVYRLNISKHGLKFSPNGQTVGFLERKQFHFDASQSKYDLNLNVTTLNVPLVVAYRKLPTIPSYLRWVVKYLLSKQSFFFTATADELLFKGKKNLVSCLAHAADPALQPDCLFMYLRGINNSAEGPYQLHTGLDDIEKLNSIIKFNGSDKLSVWDGDECNEVGGASNGELFSPLDALHSQPKKLHFFRSDFCRVINFTLTEPSIAAEVNAINVDRFQPEVGTLDNVTVNPRNWCYKANKRMANQSDDTKSKVSITELFNLIKKEGVPFDFKSFKEIFAHKNESSIPEVPDYAYNSDPSEKPSGVFDLSACQQGVPIFLSYPHFYKADPFYLQQVSGLSPNESKHQTYLDVEPKTGTPVDFLARLQINVDVDPRPSGRQMRPVLLPTLWQEFSIHITPAMASMLESQTETPTIASFSLSSLILMIGAVLILYASMLLLIHFHNNRRTGDESRTTLLNDSDPLISSDDDANNNVNGTSASVTPEPPISNHPS